MTLNESRPPTAIDSHAWTWGDGWARVRRSGVRRCGCLVAWRKRCEARRTRLEDGVQGGSRLRRILLRRAKRRGVSAGDMARETGWAGLRAGGPSAARTVLRPDWRGANVAAVCFTNLPTCEGRPTRVRSSFERRQVRRWCAHCVVRTSTSAVLPEVSSFSSEFATCAGSSVRRAWRRAVSARRKDMGVSSPLVYEPPDPAQRLVGRQPCTRHTIWSASAASQGRKRRSIGNLTCSTAGTRHAQRPERVRGVRAAC